MSNDVFRYLHTDHEYDTQTDTSKSDKNIPLDIFEYTHRLNDKLFQNEICRSDKGFSRGRNINNNQKGLFFNEFHFEIIPLDTMTLI